MNTSQLGVQSLLMMVVLFFSIHAPAAVFLAKESPGWQETMDAGPYRILVRLPQYPPTVEEAVRVIIIPQNIGQLSGRIVAEPGLGTDAIAARTTLMPDPQVPGALTGSVRLSVRGSWILNIELTGPQGPGKASIDLIASAPDAVPPWLGWIIGLSPLLGCAWLVWHQYRYRQRLLAQEVADGLEVK